MRSLAKFSVLTSLLVAMVVALAGCEAHKSAKDTVRAQLKDGDSAKFRNLYTNKIFSGHFQGGKFINDAVTCGEVNAKNGYGAYTGFKRFYVHGSAHIPEDDNERELGSLSAYCDQKVP